MANLKSKEDVSEESGDALHIELGTTGLRQRGGYIHEEWLKEFSGTRRFDVIKEMRDNDPIVGAILFSIGMLMRQTKWTSERANDTAKARDAAEFLQTCMDDMTMSWDQTLDDIRSFLEFGFSYHEPLYKVRRGFVPGSMEYSSKHNDNRIGWRSIPGRAQESLSKWEFDKDNDQLLGMWQYTWLGDTNKRGQAFIPINDALLFRTTAKKGNPEGRSILRNSYRSWKFKKRIEEIEGIGIERDLAGMPVIVAPSRIMSAGATTEEAALYQEILTIIKNIRNDDQDGVVLPSDVDRFGNRIFDISLMSTGGKRQFDTNAIVNRYDQRIAMTVLADFVLLGHESVGSFALSDSKTALFATATGTWLKEIQDVFNNFAIPKLMALNGINRKHMPTIKHGNIETPDLKVLGAFLRNMSGSGAEIFPNAELENKLLESAGLPQTRREEQQSPSPDTKMQDVDPSQSLRALGTK